jgi:hypothetical protein
MGPYGSQIPFFDSGPLLKSLKIDPIPIQKLKGVKMSKRMKHMFLPDDVLGLIKEYSRPIGLRLDWRTCKRNESRRIKGSNLALLLWYKWFINGREYELPLYDEVKEWTFYGLRHLIRVSRYRFWTQEPRGWYERRFVEVAQQDGWPFLQTGQSIEYNMGNVSLIV